MKLTLLTLLLCSNIFALESYQYLGIATDIKGNFLYKEVHLEKWDNGVIISALTRYLDDKEQEIALLENDFTKSVSFPQFHFKNKKDQHQHGVKIVNDEYEMFKIDDGVKKGEKYRPTSDSVTGQGFHFNLVQKLDQLKLKDKGIFDFVIPGRLTSYTFAYEVIERDESTLTIKVSMNNFFLKLIAPSMRLRYNLKTKRLIDYEGLSNVYQNQAVKITYQHD